MRIKPSTIITCATSRSIPCPPSVSPAHELSGLGSTRVVRFSVSARRRIDEPDDVATGSQDEKIQGCVEPMGEEGTVGIGGERVAGDVAAAVPPLPGPLRGRGTCWPG